MGCPLLVDPFVDCADGRARPRGSHTLVALVANAAHRLAINIGPASALVYAGLAEALRAARGAARIVISWIVQCSYALNGGVLREPFSGCD